MQFFVVSVSSPFILEITGDPFGSRSNQPCFASTTGARSPSSTVYPNVPATSSPVSLTGGPKTSSLIFKGTETTPL